MRLPKLFNRRETRAQSYTDLVLQSLLSTSAGDVAQGYTAAREVAAGAWQRAFSAARLAPDGVIADAVTPYLGFIGRALVLHGEAIFAVDFDDGLQLIPVSSATITGGPTPSSWTYELVLAGPSSTSTRHRVPAEEVLHLFYSRGPRNPWKGVSPIAASQTTRTLLDNIERRLAEELGSAVGSVITVPNIETTSQLQADLRSLSGEVTLVESTASNYGAGATGAPAQDFKPQRIGGDPPVTITALRRQVEQSILASAGVPTSSLGGADAGASREQYRQFASSVCQPVLDGVAAQIGAHFETELTVDLSRLFASDLSGKARAFQSMVKGGLDVTKAATLAGLMVEE